MTGRPRTALVTAATSGIGLEAARGLVGRGISVVVSGRTERRAEAAAAAVGATGWVVGTLDEPTDVEAMVSSAADVVGTIDILVSNSGGPPPARFADLTPEDWIAAYRLLLDSALRMTRGVLPGMVEQRWGRLIYLTSSGVRQPLPGLHLSNVLRSAVDALARSLVPETAPSGVTSNAVGPAHVDTDRYRSIMASRATAAGEDTDDFVERHRVALPLRRFGEASEVASVVGFLASDESSYITGQTLYVDGGSTGVSPN